MTDKVQTALDETRMLVLGVQVLIGFGFRGVLEPGFQRLSGELRAWNVAAVAAELVTFAILLMPSTSHRLCERGECTPGLHRFTTLCASASLLPFAFALSVGVGTAFRAVGSTAAWVAGAASGVMALAFWYGIELAARALGKETPVMEPDASVPPTKLGDKIRQALTEVRVVLPGAQAVLGFQFASTLMRGFDDLAPQLKAVHLASLALVAIATILLMLPAAWHRIVEQGEDTPRFLALAGRTLLVALVPLAIGMSLELWMVVAHVSGSMAMGGGAAAGMLAVFVGLWFVVPLLRRRIHAVDPRPSHPPRGQARATNLESATRG